MGRNRAARPGEAAQTGLPKVIRSAQAELPRQPRVESRAKEASAAASFLDSDPSLLRLPQPDPASLEMLMMQLAAPGG